LPNISEREPNDSEKSAHWLAPPVEISGAIEPGDGGGIFYGGGMPDRWEKNHGTNPAIDDADQDNDGDSLSNLQERLLGTHPNKIDTDGDGVPDGWEDINGMNPKVKDSHLDLNGNGRSDLVDYLIDSGKAAAILSALQILLLQ
jgi:hypothetical protein